MLFIVEDVTTNIPTPNANKMSTNNVPTTTENSISITDAPMTTTTSKSSVTNPSNLLFHRIKFVLEHFL